MQHVILGLLLSGPLSSYDVHKRFATGLALIYSASFGGIQRALKQLLADGSVTVSEVEGTRRGTKLYTITPAGRDAWRAWMFDAGGGGDAEVGMLARVYLLGLLAPGERRAVVTALKERALRERSVLQERARDVDAQDVPNTLADVFRFQRATLDYGLRAHRLALTWLDELADSLDEPAQPTGEAG